MTDLVEFLLARIAEDEARARATWGERWAASEGPDYVEVLVALRADAPLPPRPLSGLWGQVCYWDRADQEQVRGQRLEDVLPAAEHIAAWDPARVLRECESKRRIVAWFGPVNESDDAHTYDVVLGSLAAVYDSHPDYDPKWALSGG